MLEVYRVRYLVREGLLLVALCENNEPSLHLDREVERGLGEA